MSVIFYTLKVYFLFLLSLEFWRIRPAKESYLHPGRKEYDAHICVIKMIKN